MTARCCTLSGILEPAEVDSPIAGMLRFDTEVDPFTSPMLIEVDKFLRPAAGPQRTVLARTMVNDPKAKRGFISNAARHQDFNTDADTCGSLVAMIEA